MYQKSAVVSIAQTVLLVAVVASTKKIKPPWLMGVAYRLNNLLLPPLTVL